MWSVIKIERTDVSGWEASIRGLRNPMNSWDKSDSHWCNGEDCPMVENQHEPAYDCAERTYCLGEKDFDLMKRLVKSGSDHSKFMRMLLVTVDVTAPLYWWKEFDTYKVGTVANSCSTMHKIHAKEFTYEDFSMEHIGHVPNCDPMYYAAMDYVIMALNEARHCYLDTKDKAYWWQMIQLLPTSYNQKRTVQVNYAVLKNMYHARKNHKLDEWHEFCRWIEALPYSELITEQEKGELI